MYANEHRSGSFDISKSYKTGAYSEEVPPVPIPNTEVKLFCGDDTALRESSAVPDFSLRPGYMPGLFVFRREI